MFRHDAFEHIGLLDERYHLYFEDVDWVLRAQRQGWRCLLATDAVAFHQHAASTRLLGEPTRYELVQRNLLLCAAKNLTARAGLRIWLQRLIVQIKGTISGPYRAQRLRSIGRALLGLPSALIARRRLPPARQQSEAELFAYSVGLNPQFDVTTYSSHEQA